jgi:hypothetical protein
MSSLPLAGSVLLHWKTCQPQATADVKSSYIRYLKRGNHLRHRSKRSKFCDLALICLLSLLNGFPVTYLWFFFANGMNLCRMILSSNSSENLLLKFSENRNSHSEMSLFHRRKGLPIIWMDMEGSTVPTLVCIKYISLSANSVWR